MKKAGVIGHPITHTLSPKIHGYWLNKYGIKGSYEAYDVAPEGLENFIKNLAKNGFRGINVTIPHKQEVMKYIDEIHPDALAIGAVNTIIVEDGKTYGHNTDSQGFMANLQDCAPDIDLFEQKVVILGSGGASRAVAVGLLEEGAKLVVANRTRARAEEMRAHIIRELAETFPEVKEKDAITLVDWEKRNEALAGAALLVNTTSQGMKGEEELLIDLAKLPKDAAVADIVYNPLKTKLLREAETRGNIVVEGLGMLLYQAEPGFYAWFGKRPEVTKELRSNISKELSK